MGTEVQVLTVIHPFAPLLPAPACVIAAIHVEQAKELQRHAPGLVAAASEQLRDSVPDVNVTTKIVEGVPKDVIVREARECQRSPETA